MERTTGIGGIFFKAKDPDGLQKWYENHLGLKPDPDGCVVFRWRERDEAASKASTVWAPFPADTKYFGNGSQTAMVNYRVKNLDACWRNFVMRRQWWMIKLRRANTGGSLG